MANYAASVLATGQAVIAAKYNTAEQRRQLPSVMQLALQNTEYSIPNANILRVSPLRPVQVYYMKNIAPGSTTAKAYNHTGSTGDTGAVTLTYVTHVEKFSLSEKQMTNNVIGYEKAVQNMIMSASSNLRTRHDNSALAYVYANRVQLASGVMNPQIASANPGTYNATNFALEVSLANKPMFMQLVKSYLAARFYTGELDVIADLQKTRDFLFQLNQGGGNYQNLAYQFYDANIATTQQVIDSNYTYGSVLAMPKGSLVGLNWNEELNRTGSMRPDPGGPVGTFGTMADPMGSGAVYDVSMYTQRADTSSNTSGGSTEDVVQQWEFTSTIAYALPPLSTSLDSVVHEVSQLNS